MKVWKSYSRGTFMKGINNIMEPTAPKGNTVDHITYPIIAYNTMNKRESFQAAISQYPPEIQTILDIINISDEVGLEMMHHILTNDSCAGSGGSVKGHIEGHAFYITDNAFI